MTCHPSSRATTTNSRRSWPPFALRCRPVPGDGNIDFVVNAEDLANWRFYSHAGSSSVFDLNLDGLTSGADQTIIEDHLGLDCRTE
jgi:hypothetical protein